MQFGAFSANFFAGFLIMPFLIHHLGDRGYGFWALVGTIVGQFGILDAGLMSTTQRFIANALAKDDYEEGTVIFSTSIVIFWGLGTMLFLAVLTVALLAGYWIANGRELLSFQIALTVSGLNLALLFPFAVMQGALAAHLRSDAATIGQFVCTLVRTVLAFATITMGYGIVALAIGNLVASLSQRSILLLMMRKHLPGIAFRPSAVNWRTTKELFAFGRFIFLVNAGDAARYRFHNLIVAALGGVSAVTHYSVAVRLADYFQAMLSRLSTVTSPVYARHFTRGEYDLLREKYLTLTRLGAIVCCVFVSGAIVFGHPFVRLWLGGGFDDSYISLAILLIGMFFAMLQHTSRSVLRAIYKHEFDATSNLIEVFANLTLAVLLVPRFGIVGAAIGTAVPIVIVKGIVLPIYVGRTIGLPLWQFYRAVSPYILSTCIVSAATAFVAPLGKINSLLVLTLVGAVYSVILFSMLLLLLPRRDKASVVNAIGRTRIQRLPGGAMLLNAMAV